MHDALLIVMAGLFAGAINAAAGGGSFVSVPALIWAGVPSISANMSSTVALYPASFTSALAFRTHERSLLGVSFNQLCCITLAGGFCGALLLLHTSNASFDAFLPWLMLLGAVAFAFGKTVGLTFKRFGRPSPALLFLAQFLLGVYGGYFGGAVGIMMMAVWSMFGTHDLDVLNPIKVLFVAAANTIAVVCFAFFGSVAWRQTLLMCVAAAAGGYLGAHVALRVHPKRLRVAVSILNFLLTAMLFARNFGRLS
jgi:uncharacterized protein